MICNNYTKTAKGCKPTDHTTARRADPRQTVRPAVLHQHTPHPTARHTNAADASPRRIDSRAQHRAQLTANADATAPLSPRTAPHNRRKQKSAASAAREPQQQRRADTPPPAMGGTRPARAGGGEAHIGGVAHTQTAFSPSASSRKSSCRPRVGDRVVNVSGRGKWRVGVVVFVVPCGVQPRAWCSMRGFPGLFHASSAPTCRERYVVKSGGVLFTPEKVEVR